MIGIDEVITKIGVGDTVKLTGTYEVKQDDIDKGTPIRNVAIVGDEEDKQEPDIDIPVKQEPGLQLYKEVISGIKEYKLNEVIEYKVTVTNTGNTTQTGIVVNDPISNEISKTIEETIIPGGHAEVTFTHTVNEQDIEKGEVVNTATAGDYSSNPVTTDVDTTYKYTVIYYRDETVEIKREIMPEQEVGTIITAPQIKYMPEGYEYDRTEGAPLTITANEENNVIKVYYKKANCPYTINYYKDEISESNRLGEPVTGTAEYGSEITADTKLNCPIGYKLGSVTPSSTITIGIENNVIDVVYVKDLDATKNLEYTIKYYKKETVDAQPVYTGDYKVTQEPVWVGSEQTTLTYQKDVETSKYENYTLEKVVINGTTYTDVNQIPATLNDKTVIEVYYVKNVTDYTVTYYVNNKQVWQDTEIKEGTIHIVKDDSELTVIPPSGYVFAGTWHDDEENTYVIGQSITINSDLNLYADFITVSDAESEANSFWQNKVTGWGPATANEFTPVVINGDYKTQVFYCKNPEGTIHLTNNGGVTSIDGVSVGSKEEMTFEVGNTYIIHVNRGKENLDVEVTVKWLNN